MVFHGFSWFQVGFSWFFMVFHGSRLVFHGFSWFFMVPGWFFMVFLGFKCFFLVFHNFPWFFIVFLEIQRKVLQNCRKSSCGGCARPEKHRSSTSGGRKVVCDVIFLSADMFRAGLDTHFSWVRPLLGPANYFSE